MRQRVRSKGFEGLEPHEIIEFLLFYAIPRQDVNELAHRLIDRFGSVRGVLEAELPELESVPGVGKRTARWLALVGEATAACAHLSAEDRPVLKNCREAFHFAAKAERKLTPPCCVQLCLDINGRLLYRRTFCNSLSWGEPATLREALGDMLSIRAHSAILLLATGAQDPEPQDYDAIHAANYAATLRAAECELLDVILVAGDRFSSMERCGLIPKDGSSPHLRALHEDYYRDMPQGELLIQDFRDSD